MNNKELIEKYELELKDVQLKFGASFKTKVYEELLDDLKQLDEPQKPTVPQFVADWYEKNKNNFEENIYDCIVGQGIHSNEIREWIRETKSFQTLVNMHQFGYTVEKEKRYLVKVNVENCSTKYLVFGEITGSWFFAHDKYGNVIIKHTRKELEEAGFGEVFGWVFDCEGVEVEEVE